LARDPATEAEDARRSQVPAVEIARPAGGGCARGNNVVSVQFLAQILDGMGSVLEELYMGHQSRGSSVWDCCLRTTRFVCICLSDPNLPLPEGKVKANRVR
jgi:hypothetical protein